MMVSATRMSAAADHRLEPDRALGSSPACSSPTRLSAINMRTNPPISLSSGKVRSVVATRASTMRIRIAPSTPSVTACRTCSRGRRRQASPITRALSAPSSRSTSTICNGTRNQEEASLRSICERYFGVGDLGPVVSRLRNADVGVSTSVAPLSASACL